MLGGGLLSGSATLVRGAPGAGKTIFALQFLAAGVEAEGVGLYINPYGSRICSPQKYAASRI